MGWHVGGAAETPSAAGRVSNVNERLRTIYGAGCTLKLTSERPRHCRQRRNSELTVAERVTA